MVLSAAMRAEILRQRLRHQAAGCMERRDAVLDALRRLVTQFERQRESCLTPGALLQAGRSLAAILESLSQATADVLIAIQRWHAVLPHGQPDPPEDSGDGDEAEFQGGIGEAQPGADGLAYLLRMRHDLEFLQGSALAALLPYVPIPANLLPDAAEAEAADLTEKPPPGVSVSFITSFNAADLTPMQRTVLEGLQRAGPGLCGAGLPAPRRARPAPPLGAQGQVAARLSAGLSSEPTQAEKSRTVPVAEPPRRLQWGEQQQLIDRVYYDAIHLGAKAWTDAQGRVQAQQPRPTERRYRSPAVMAERMRALSEGERKAPAGPEEALGPRLSNPEVAALVKRLHEEGVQARAERLQAVHAKYLPPASRAAKAPPLADLTLRLYEEPVREHRRKHQEATRRWMPRSPPRRVMSAAEVEELIERLSPHSP
eukprot:EG_transcript_9615